MTANMLKVLSVLGGCCKTGENEMENIHSQFEALDRIKEINKVIDKAKRGLPYPGSRPNKQPFYPELQKIHEAYIGGNEVYSKEWSVPENMISYNSGNGSPLLQHAFLPAIKEAIDSLQSKGISQYAYASGDKECRLRVAKYLYREGIRSNAESGRISENNIIFFNSTTEAFTLLMKVICRPGDVVLFTAPTYGLLAYAPERIGAESRFVQLREEDKWMLNPDRLEDKIRTINKELSIAYESKGYEYTPCVAAFVNINPNNPTGCVMGKDELWILKRINDICCANAVLVIDDIIYRDLCYDMSNKAIPIASIEGAFSNTITLFGTSKSYGLAGARAGAILADECIIRGLRNELFQLMDSTSLTVSHLLAGSFDDSLERDNYYKSYFSNIISQYKSNWNLLQILVEGENANRYLDEGEKKLVKKYFSNITEKVEKHGIGGLKIAGHIVPQAGFFALVDFSKLLGCKDHETGELLCSEMDILYYIYREANVKLLVSASFAWPISGQVVARMSYAYEKEDLARLFYQVYVAIRKLGIE